MHDSQAINGPIRNYNGIDVFSWRDCITESPLPSSAKFVLVVISFYLDENGFAWPSVKTIAQKTGFSERCVHKQIAMASEQGYLSIHKRRPVGPGAAYEHNVYRAHYTPQFLHNRLSMAHPDLEINYSKRKPHEPRSGGEKTTCTTFTNHLNQVHTNSLENSSIKKKNIKKKSDTMKLVQWEEINGQLTWRHMEEWLRNNRIQPRVINPVIEEFRNGMMANATEYADFSAAFKNWMNRGFCSKTIAALQAETEKLMSQSQGGLEIHGKGVSL